MWQQITPFTLQRCLNYIYATFLFLHTPSTYDPIRPFLEHDIASLEDEKKVKKLLREAWGTLEQPAPEGVDPVGNWGKHMSVLKDIQVYWPKISNCSEWIECLTVRQERFMDQPGKYEEFIRLGLGEWKEGRPVSEDSGREARKKAEEMLANEPDLSKRFGEFYASK